MEKMTRKKNLINIIYYNKIIAIITINITGVEGHIAEWSMMKKQCVKGCSLSGCLKKPWVFILKLSWMWGCRYCQV